MEVRLPFDFFRAPAGTPFYLIENTYALEVCDVCGKKRTCDYYQSKDPVVFLDVCRSCRNELNFKKDEGA